MENFCKGEITEQSYSTPHPRTPDFLIPRSSSVTQAADLIRAICRPQEHRQVYYNFLLSELFHFCNNFQKCWMMCGMTWHSFTAYLVMEQPCVFRKALTEYFVVLSSYLYIWRWGITSSGHWLVSGVTNVLKISSWTFYILISPSSSPRLSWVCKLFGIQVVIFPVSSHTSCSTSTPGYVPCCRSQIRTSAAGTLQFVHL